MRGTYRFRIQAPTTPAATTSNHSALSSLKSSPTPHPTSRTLPSPRRPPLHNLDNGTFLPALPLTPKYRPPPPASILTDLTPPPPQAYRVITQVLLIGSRVLGRAFTEAYKQAAASSQYQRAQAKAGINPTGGRASVATGMTLEEACKILNVKPPQGGQANMEEVMERFKRLFDANEPANGGSFYLQSKIVRARERIEAEARPLQEKAEAEAEVKEGWKPKVYKDR